MKFSGKIGYATQSETSPGVWEETITEREYLGDVVQRTETFTQGDSVLPQYRTTTSVSVLSDGVLKSQYSDIRYVTYLGKRWTISSVVYQHPRMILYIGEVYNGPTPN